MTDYLEKFIIKQIEYYIPDGIDGLTHIHSRAFMFEIVLTLIKQKKVPVKLSVIKYLCMNYKEMIYSKLSVLN
tara:strand:- start:407 stop:625 length:219 start_codon:yes stop_codon:yes gene_type:complete